MRIHGISCNMLYVYHPKMSFNWFYMKNLECMKLLMQWVHFTHKHSSISWWCKLVRTRIFMFGGYTKCILSDVSNYPAWKVGVVHGYSAHILSPNVITELSVAGHNNDSGNWHNASQGCSDIWLMTCATELSFCGNQLLRWAERHYTLGPIALYRGLHG